MERALCETAFRCDKCGESRALDDMAYVGLVGESFKTWLQECRRCSNERLGLPEDLGADDSEKGQDE